MTSFIRFFFTYFVFQSIAFAEHSDIDIKAIASQYFDVYAERKNFNDFMSFYDESVILEDIVYGNHIKGKSALSAFFNWPDKKFVMTSEVNLVLSQLLVDGMQVSAQGYFTQFEYGGEVMGPWRFTMHLTFNERGKIVKQVDWINYTPRENFLGGENLNDSLPPL